jgi:hypothetical protein
VRFRKTATDEKGIIARDLEISWIVNSASLGIEKFRQYD